MAQGDWSVAHRLRPTLVNITFDASGEISHVGMGFEVYGPSGRMLLRSGWTWGHLDGPAPKAADLKSLQKVMSQFVGDLAIFEGAAIDWSVGLGPPQDVPSNQNTQAQHPPT